MDAAVAAPEAVAAAVSTSSIVYEKDLVSYGSVRGLANLHTWACTSADEFEMVCAGGESLTKKAGDTDVTLHDRSYLHAGQIVVSASDVGGQIGVVTGVTTMVDLVQLKDSGDATEVQVTGVPPSTLRRARALSLGDYVVHGSWLGRVVEVSLDVDVTFDDGAVCRVTDAESKEGPLATTARCYCLQSNSCFYPGLRVVNSAVSAFFRGSRWLKGHRMLVEGEVGTVARVEMTGVLVHWIASAHFGTDQQLVEENAPPAYQNPDNLTFFCSDSSCIWAVGDKCFLQENSLIATPSAPSVSIPDHQDEPTAPAALITKKEQEERSPTDRKHQKKQRHYKRSAQLSTMTVSNTHTTVDVLWQDGTRHYGAPSTSLNPFRVMNDDEVFPGQYVIDATVDDITGDDTPSVAKGYTRRIGVVKSVNSKDHMVNLSWFKQGSLPDEANRWEAECDDTVSAYDLDTDPDQCVFYGDVVLRLLPNISGSTQLVQQPQAQCIQKRATADLSWVGRVVDLHDGHVQVKWGDGTISTVLPHEISVANKEHYTILEAEMGDWVEEDNVDAPQEIGDDNMDNDPTDPIDARNIEGATVETGQDSKNELDSSAASRTGRLGGFIQSMIQAVVQVLARGKWYVVNGSASPASHLSQTTQNAESPVHASTGIQKDPNLDGAETEAILAPVIRSDASIDDDDLAEDVVKAREADGDEDLSNFPRFDVVQSPPDHHYLDSMDEGGTAGKTWIKAVQKEWKILENSLPDTIYVRAFEDRMDLFRAVMVGASGTPYQDGLFFFDMHLPPSYPEVPPEVYYHSFGLRLNPNLDESGTVCLSLLDTFGGEDIELWSPGTSSLLQVVVSIQALVLNDQPFYNENGYKTLVDKPEGQRNALPYSENAFLLTLRTALHLLRRPPKGFEGFISEHFRRRGRYVLRRCEAYLRGYVPTEDGGMELLCSAGFKITLGNIVPRLAVAFTEIGAEGCEHCPLTTAQQTLI
ncbi:unnamed protein product [Alopecurus aequalis]